MSTTVDRVAPVAAHDVGVLPGSPVVPSGDIPAAKAASAGHSKPSEPCATSADHQELESAQSAETAWSPETGPSPKTAENFEEEQQDQGDLTSRLRQAAHILARAADRVALKRCGQTTEDEHKNLSQEKTPALESNHSTLRLQNPPLTAIHAPTPITPTDVWNPDIDVPGTGHDGKNDPPHSPAGSSTELLMSAQPT